MAAVRNRRTEAGRNLVRMEVGRNHRPWEVAEHRVHPSLGCPAAAHRWEERTTAAVSLAGRTCSRHPGASRSNEGESPWCQRRSIGYSWDGRISKMARSVMSFFRKVIKYENDLLRVPLLDPSFGKGSVVLLTLFPRGSRVVRWRRRSTAVRGLLAIRAGAIATLLWVATLLRVTTRAVLRRWSGATGLGSELVEESHRSK